MAEAFECFGSDSSDDENGSNNNDIISNNNCHDSTTCTIQYIQQSAKVTREKSCGVLAFHPNTESSLLMHVRNHYDGHFMDNKEQTISCGKNNDPTTIPPSSSIAAENVLTQIDNFCDQRHWMMHVGPEKGQIVIDALHERINTFLSSHQNQSDIEKGMHGKRVFTCVELGTYCGYASILLANQLSIMAKRHQDIDFHLFTVEINPTYATIAKELIKLAKLDNYVSVLMIDLLMDGSVSHVGELLQRTISEESGGKTTQTIIDFLLIDHDKDSYLDDLKKIEDVHLIGKGSVVVADNVVFAKIEDYMQYMSSLAKQNVVRTRLVRSKLEYCNPDVINDDNDSCFEDGVEITTYL